MKLKNVIRKLKNDEKILMFTVEQVKALKEIMVDFQGYSELLTKLKECGKFDDFEIGYIFGALVYAKNTALSKEIGRAE